MTQRRRVPTTLVTALTALLLGLPGAAAFQPDAAFLAYQEKNKDKWAFFLAR